MTVFSSLYVLPKRLFILNQQIDNVCKELEVYQIALNEIYSLAADKRMDSIEVLQRDLKKHSFTLSAVEQALTEFMSLDLTPMFIERTEALYHRLNELQQFHQVLENQTNAALLTD